MKKKTDFMNSSLALLVLTGSLAIAACSKDENIDLNDIDTTIGIGADGFELPASSSNAIKLSDVLTLNEGDCVQTLKADSGKYKKGDYQFKKADKISSANPKVKRVTFGSPTGIDNNFSINVTSEWVAAASLNLPVGDMKFPLPETMIKAFSFSNEGEKAVIKLEHATTEDLVIIDLDFSQFASCIERANFKLVFPDFIEATIKQDQTTGFDANDIEKVELNNGVLSLTDTYLNRNKHIVLSLSGLTNFQNGATPASDQDYLIVRKDSILINGHIKMSGEVDAHYLKPATITAGTKEIKSSINFGDEICITQAQGYFSPEININPSDVEIGSNIPDFLTDNKVKIDLANPVIKLQVKSNIDAKAIVNAKMVAFYDDAKNDSLVMYIDGISTQPHTGDIKNSTTTTIVICREAGSQPGVDYIVKNQNSSKKTSAKYEVADLGALMTRIPKSFSFVLDANTDDTYLSKIDLYDERQEGQENAVGLQYKIDPSYEFVAPLELNPGSIIVYKDTIDGWNDDLKDNDIELYEGKLMVTANIYNGTPLMLSMTPTVVGVDKKPLQGIRVKVPGSSDNTLFVDSHYGKSTGSVTPIQLELVREGGSFKDVDGLMFNVEARSKTRGTLNEETQKIIINDIKIKIDGKVSVKL